MGYDKMDSPVVYAMFEEIKSKLDKRSETVSPATSAAQTAAIAELREAIAQLKAAADRPQKPQEHIHKHRIDIGGSKALIVLASAMTVIVILSWTVGNQRNTIARLRDNDLKYRYIEMRGAAGPEDILTLREVFDFDRSPDSIKVIRKRVEKYERLMKKEAERQARVRLNAEQAERLRQRAAAVKENR